VAPVRFFCTKKNSLLRSGTSRVERDLSRGPPWEISLGSMPTTLYAVPGKEMEVVAIQSDDSSYNAVPQKLANPNPGSTPSISGLDGGQQLHDGEKKRTMLQKLIPCETQRNPIPSRNRTSHCIPTQSIPLTHIDSYPR